MKFVSFGASKFCYRNFQTSMTFFLNRSIFFWYMLTTLTLTHLVLLIDRYITKYEVDSSDVLLGPLATEYQGNIFLKHIPCLTVARKLTTTSLFIVSIRFESIETNYWTVSLSTSWLIWTFFQSRYVAANFINDRRTKTTVLLVNSDIVGRYMTVSVLFMLSTLCAFIDLTSLNYKGIHWSLLFNRSSNCETILPCTSSFFFSSKIATTLSGFSARFWTNIANYLYKVERYFVRSFACILRHPSSKFVNRVSLWFWKMPTYQRDDIALPLTNCIHMINLCRTWNNTFLPYELFGVVLISRFTYSFPFPF